MRRTVPSRAAASLTAASAALVCLPLAAPAAAQDALVNWESPHVSPLCMTPNGLRLLAVNTPDNRLEVFSLASGTPVHEASIPVGLDPVSVRARNDGEAWVVNHVSDSVSVVDLALLNVKATLATDDEPCDVVFAGLPRRAYVSCSQPSTLLVFDPAALGAAPQRIALAFEEPRAMVAQGKRVYVASFESGNRTTVLGGGAVQNIGFPPNVASDPSGPYGGTNPPPNSGASFDPPIAPLLPAPPRVALIVGQPSANGPWLDDNGGDWTALVSGADAAKSGRPVGWKLLDHDVAIVDTDTNAVTYADGLMNLNMAIALHPAGAVTTVGTEATNVVRFEPNLTGTFVRPTLAGFATAAPATVARVDLNPHLDFSSGTVPQPERDESVGDPRGLAWSSDGQRAWVTGMGSNNVAVLDAAAQRATAAPIAVGEGPTGLALDEARQRVYVLNKFESSLSVLSTATDAELARVPFFDPSPREIKRGRRHLYDTHETSGTGVVSCASCHVDARLDRLAWDLGDPSGDMKDVDNTQNLGMNLPGLNNGFQDWHPMKGPMLTQTLQDIIGKEPHHWRGDRDGIEEFSGAFVGLLGDDEVLTAAEMQEFEDFLATIHYPPNPFRNFDNSLPTSLPLPGHFTTGRFGPAGQPLPNGNAVTGQNVYRPPTLLDANAISCVTCHTRPTGAGSDHRLQGFTFQPFPAGPLGERHLALVSSDGLTNVTMKIPQLRNLYERTGFNLTQLENTAGFGYLHDGSVDSIERFVNEPIFTVTGDQMTADLVAFMLAFGGVTGSQGSTGLGAQEPPGPPSKISHAAVGKQLTLAGAPTPAQDARIDEMLALADLDQVGVVVKGRAAGLARGWTYLAAGLFQSDRLAETPTRAELVALASPASELTFTVVPRVSERRIGVDRDSDGWFDRDELDAGSDPAAVERFRRRKL